MIFVLSWSTEVERADYNLNILFHRIFVCILSIAIKTYTDFKIGIIIKTNLIRFNTQ